MVDFSKVKDVSNAYFEELENAAAVRSAFLDLVVAQSGSLYAAFSGMPNETKRLSAAMRLKDADENTFFRGLLVQVVSVFESAVRDIVQVVVDTRSSSVASFREHPEKFKTGFLRHSGGALRHYGSGTVNGVKFDFSRLVNSLKSCFVDDGEYHILPRVFTIQMGNCTSSRLDDLFDTLSINVEKIMDEVGESAEIKAYFKETRKSPASALARQELDLIMSRRNDVAHGELTVAVTESAVIDAILFCQALIGALVEVCEKRLKARP